MGNRKRSRIQNSSPVDKLGVNEQQDNVKTLHPLLINLIVRHVMEFSDLTDIRKFRGVNRVWNQEAIGLLRELKKPLFYLRLDSTRNIDGNRYVEVDTRGDKKTMMDLSKIVGLASSGSWPPISLDVANNYDLQSAKQRKNLFRIFENHVSDLVKLIVSRSEESCETLIPPGTTLPLKNLKLNNYSESFPNFEANFLSACTELQKLEIEVTYEDEFGRFRSWPDLQLPESLSMLKLSLDVSEENSKDIVSLTGKPLPNLTKLSLRIAKVAFDNGAFHKLLKSFRTSLKYLHIIGKYYVQHIPETLEEYRFPVMDKLEELKFEHFWQPLEPNINNLHLYLPKLKTLSLIDSNDSCTEKWLSGYRQESVTSLRINCVEETESGTEFFGTDKKMIARICTTFPNLTNLSLAFSRQDVSGLCIVFENMQQLEKLTIFCKSVKTMMCELGSVLLEPSAKKKQELDLAGLETQNDRYSLISLKKLRQLCIGKIPSHWEYEIYDKRHRNPDALFTRAFLKMDSLRCLCLERELMPTEPVARTWRSKGRTLEVYEIEMDLW